MLLSYILLTVFFLSFIVIAYLASKKQSVESFLIADRKLNSISAISTINASKTGSIVFIFTAFIYAYGLSAIWYFVGMSIGYLVFIPFAIKIFRKHGETHYTLPQYFADSHGKLAGKFAALSCIIAMFGSMTLNLIAASKVFSFFTGSNSITATLIIGIVVLMYLLLSGFSAVVKTDLFQYVIILLLLVVFTCFLLIGPGVAEEDLTLSKAGVKNMVSFFLFGLLLPFAQPELWQRVYALPDEKTLKRSLIVSIVLHFLVAIFLSLIGLSIKNAFPDLTPDNAFLEGLSLLLPDSLTVLILIAFFSILMSSIDTYAYTGASNLVQDFLPKTDKKNTVRQIRIAITAFIILGCIATIFLPGLVDAAFIFSGFLILIAIPVIATHISDRVPPLVINYTIPLSFLLWITYITYLSINTNLTPIVLLFSVFISLGSILFSFVVYLLYRTSRTIISKNE